MSLFDFFFPEQAQAMHLRDIARTGSLNSVRDRHDRRAVAGHEIQQLRAELNGAQKEIDSLRDEIGEAALVIEALIEAIDRQGILAREGLRQLVGEIDARDGVADGKVTPAAERPKEDFKPRRQWPDNAPD